MRFPWTTPATPTRSPRRSQKMGFHWDALEQRTVLSHVGGFHHLHAVAQVASVASAATSHTETESTETESSTNSALSAAQQTLRTDVQAILSHSGTTVGQLTAVRTAFQTLKADGLKPTSRSALSSFEDGLVTAFAGGTTLAGNATLLSQFEALYTSTPTTQQTTDLTTAYNALASAVTSSNITSANIATINTDFAAVLAAEGSTSTATYPYFSLVTGGHIRLGGGERH